MLHEMLKSLAAAGHDVEVSVADQGEGTYPVDGVRVHYGRKSVTLVKERAMSGKYDVIISHLKEYDRAFAIARTSGTKLVQVMHNDNGDSRISHVLSADLTVFNTHWLRKSLGGKGLVVHPPVWPAEHRTKRGDHVTLVNLIPPKGCDLFYDLAARMPDVQFLGVRGGYGRQVVQQLPNVTIQPTTGDMRNDVWSKTAVLLMPSEYESYGMVGVEALASGIPVIAHPTDGLRESLGDAGVFIDRKDVRSWERELRTILAHPTIYREAAFERSAQIDTAGEMATFVNTVESL